MSKQNKNSPTTENPGRREALRRQQAARAAAERRMKIFSRTAWIAGIALIVAMAGIIGWSVVGAKNNQSAGVSAGGSLTPANATAEGAIRFGQADAPVTVTVYADFMCPYCGQFERANGETLDKLVDEGTIKLDIHPMAFLDSQSGGTKYSTRAANAFATVANADQAAALKFSQLLFTNQPSEGSTGLTDDQLAAFATQAGASSEVVAKIADNGYTGWIDELTQQAFNSGITGTPTVKINGETFTGDIYNAGPLADAINKAATGE